MNKMGEKDESDNTNEKMGENSECPLYCFDVTAAAVMCPWQQRF
jgi:hypothetical protein